MKFQDFKVLSDQEIVQIHEASINILENAGILIYSKKALELLNSKGAIVDYDKKLVKISGKMVESCLKLAGAEVVHSDGYPGWKPNLDSKILKLSKKVFQDMHDKEAKVEAIHAGLECGILGEKFPGMDMISIGPTIKYPHSPEEQVHVSTVDKFYKYVLKILESV